MPGISPSAMLSPALNTPTVLLSRTKSTGGGTAIQCHQALTRPTAVVAAIMPACPTLALSATNVPADGMDQHFFDLHFAKLSHGGKNTHTHIHKKTPKNNKTKTQKTSNDLQ